MRKVSSLLLLVCLMMFLCTVLCGCDSYDNFIKTFVLKEAEVVPDPEEKVLIGVFEPLTGPDAPAAADEVKGIELAHSLYSEVLGKEIELVYGDNCSDDTIAVQAAQSLVDQGVCVVLGSYRNILSLAGSDVFRESRTPAITITCTNPLITQSNPYYARACFIDADQGKSAAAYGLSALKSSWFTVFMEAGDDYSSTMADQFMAEASSYLGNDYSVAVITYPKGTVDFSLYLEKMCIMRTGPVFFPSDAKSGEEVIWQAAQLGYDFEWIGCSKWNALGEAAAAAGRNSVSHLDGVCFVADYDVDESLSHMTSVFHETYAKAYGTEEEPSKSVALGFDAYLLAVEAIRQAGRSDAGTLIANKLTNITDFAGVTGNMYMNSIGDPMKDVVIEVFHNGVYSAGYKVSPDWGD